MVGIEQMVLDHGETCGSYGCECVGWFPWISVCIWHMVPMGDVRVMEKSLIREGGSKGNLVKGNEEVETYTWEGDCWKYMCEWSPIL